MASGVVKWLNNASGYGYVVPDEGGRDLFVHRASIVGDGRTATLVEGASVEFDRRDGGMGAEALNVVAAVTRGAD
jgi:cold shock protein